MHAQEGLTNQFLCVFVCVSCATVSDKTHALHTTTVCHQTHPGLKVDIRFESGKDLNNV